MSCRSGCLLGRPGVAGTSPARAYPMRPLGLLFGDLSAICSDAWTQGFLDSPRRSGHCLKLEMCALDPGSCQCHWRPPGSYAVSRDRARCRMGVKLEKVGHARAAGHSLKSTSTPSAPPPPLPPSWAACFLSLQPLPSTIAFQIPTLL